MISSSIHSNAANLYAALPIGQEQTGLKDNLARNSSFRPVEPLESSQRTTLRAGSSASPNTSAETDSSLGEPPQGGSEAEQAQKEQEARVEERQQKQVEKQEQREIASLSSRDREVRAHEQAHAAVGGQYAGAPTYQYERGPDGVNYAVSGEVKIDVGKEATPQETLKKAQIVRRAALAPAEPSPQDRRVAAQASQLEAEARADIASERAESAQETRDERSEVAEENRPSQPDLDFLAEGSDTSVTTTSSSTLEEQSQSSFSTNPFQISSLDTPRSNNVSPAGERLHRILASTAVETNRPGALLSQIV